MFKLALRLMVHDILRLAGVTIALGALVTSLVLSFALLPKAPVLGGILTGTIAFLTFSVAAGFTYAFSVRHGGYLGYLHLNGTPLTSTTLTATTLPLCFSWIGTAAGVGTGYLLLTSSKLNTFAVFVKANSAAFKYGSYPVTPVLAGLLTAMVLTLLSFLMLSLAVTPNKIRKHALI